MAGCEKAAVTQRKVPYDVTGVNGKISMAKGTPIFTCADHIKELEADLRKGLELHEKATRDSDNGAF